MAPQGKLHVLYLTHDLSDAAISKRTQMLEAGGASVSLAGFRRTSQTIDTVSGCPAVNFGQTFNGGFVQRLVSVLKLLVFLGKHKELFESADVILARNLEMLAIAVRGRSLCKNRPTIVYECLDIHRLLLNSGIIGKALRALEGWLCLRASGIITSSPAFITEYFNTLSNVRVPIRLVENKVYPVAAISVDTSPRLAEKPWKIGWFGIIRCRKSLAILAELARNSGGAVEVIIRGRPALDQFDDFHNTVNTTQGLSFHGAYKNPDDLENIYREVHFSWCIDMFEEGLNSSWLLPNRLYEGGLFKTVPIALVNVETGRTMQRMGIGLTLSEASAPELRAFFDQLTSESYRNYEKNVSALPPSSWSFNNDDCKALVEYLGSFKQKPQEK